MRQCLTFVTLFAFLPGSTVLGDDKLPVTDDTIRERTYDKNYQTPKGFVQDPTLQMPDVNLYFHQPGWFSDKKEEAHKIVEAFLAKPSNIAVKEIQETAESPRSFDFRAGTIWYRVHKPSYFTWKGERIDEVLRQAGDNKSAEIGTLKDKPSQQAVKDFAEYAWLIANHNMGGSKVISSDAREEKGKLVHDLLTVETTFGDFGLQDQIRVVRWSFAVNADNGTTTLERKQVKTLVGKKN